MHSYTISHMGGLEYENQSSQMGIPAQASYPSPFIVFHHRGCTGGLIAHCTVSMVGVGVESGIGIWRPADCEGYGSAIERCFDESKNRFLSWKDHIDILAWN
jgi:hypothetical protein